MVGIEFGGGAEYSKEYYPASLYFCDELKEAIEGGGREQIVGALDLQEQNNTTIGLSNQLMVRSFMSGQRAKLMHLEGHISRSSDLWEAGRLVGGYITQLESDFSEVFAADEGEVVCARLLDDEYLRDVIRGSGNLTTVTARYIAATDISTMLPPEAAFYTVELTKDNILNDLKEGMYFTKTEPFDADMMASIRELVADQAAVASDAISKTLAPK